MIAWGNTASNSTITNGVRSISSFPYPNFYCRSGSINIWYSDIQYGYSSAVLSKTTDPAFVGSGDYHLTSSNSPCYNSATFYLAPTNDLDGNPRPVALPQRVDMGCYELQGSSGPLGGGVDNGAGVSGMANTDPNDAAGYFEVSRRNDGLGNVIFEWASVTGRQYVVQTTTNLMTGWSFVAYVNGTGDTVSYTIPAPRDVARYYRVQLQPADIFRRASE